MSRLLLFGAIGLAAVAGLGAIAVTYGGTTSPAVEAGKSLELRRFASAADFERYLGTLRRRQTQFFSNDTAAMEAPAAAAPAGEPANPEITNNQTVGVDEGGIVKQIGRYLVVLQDGRLFSADLGTGAGAPLRLADRIDVYRSPRQAASWYDEMLVLGDRILVTAYNYREQASEITVVRMDAAGRLTPRRPLPAQLERLLQHRELRDPAGRRQSRLLRAAIRSTTRPGRPLRMAAPAARGRRRRSRSGRGADRPDRRLRAGRRDRMAGAPHRLGLPAARRGMDCRTTAFIGPAMREFYVSPTDAFLWIGAPDGLPWSIDYANQRRQACPAGEQWHAGGDEQAAMLYRLPLDGGAGRRDRGGRDPGRPIRLRQPRAGASGRCCRGRRAGCVKPDEAAPARPARHPLVRFRRERPPCRRGAYAPLPAIAGGAAREPLRRRLAGLWRPRRLVGHARPGARRGRRGSTLIAVPLARPARRGPAGPAAQRAPDRARRQRRGGHRLSRPGGPLAQLCQPAAARPRIAATDLAAGALRERGPKPRLQRLDAAPTAAA